MPAVGVVCALALLVAATVEVEASASDVGARVADGVVEVQLGGELFTRFHARATPMPYLYPVLAPGGVPMTRAWPLEERPHEEHDHPHHRSFWYAHGAVNGHDFWHDPACRMVADGAPRVSIEGGAVTVVARYAWTAGETVVLREERTLRFVAAGDRERRADVTVALTASEGEVVFGDTKEGTFAFRVHPNLRLRGDVAKGSVVNREGVTGADAWGKRSGWVAYQGPVEGAAVGVTIFDHPTNPRHPTWWHARDYGLFAANPFGAHDFEGAPAGTGDLSLAEGETLTFRYRVVLYTGRRPHEQLEAAYAAFSAGR